MGLFDKIKDLFTDEEEVYEEEKDDVVKIKEIKKDDSVKKNVVKDAEESKLPTFMREKIEEEEKEKFKIEEALEENKSDFNVSSRVNARINNNVYTEDTVEIPRAVESSFKFPVEFDDNDFVPSRTKKVASIHNFEESNNEIKQEAKREDVKPDKKVADLYKSKPEVKEERKFKATPIISPIYGVLDKNYSKDQIKEADESSYELKRNSVSKNIDFDTVRKKAYGGNLKDNIKTNLMCENCELLKEAKEEKCKKHSEDNLVYDVLAEEKNDETVVNNDITFGDATENYYDYGVPYEIPKVPQRVKKNEESFNEQLEVKIVNSEEVLDKPVKKEIPPVKSSINLLSTLRKSMGEDVISDSTSVKKEIKSEKKDLELTDDLFSLIDSMYDERND